MRIITADKTKRESQYWIEHFKYKQNLLNQLDMIKNENQDKKEKEHYKKNKIKYEGEYLDGKRNGKGKEYDKNGQLIFEGEYKKGIKWNGKIKEYTLKPAINPPLENIFC